MPGQLTRKAIASQPEWLRQVPDAVGDRRLSDGARVLFTGCGTSFHAALACGPAAQALEIVLGNVPEADVLVAISHEGETALTLEAVQGFRGDVARHGSRREPDRARGRPRRRGDSEVEQSYCHTVSYVCAVAAGRALQGEDVSSLAGAVESELNAEASPSRRTTACRGRRRTGPADRVRRSQAPRGRPVGEAHRTEQLLHGYLAAIDPSVRVLVLEGEGRAPSGRWARCGRSARSDATRRSCLGDPVVDIVRFQRLTVDLAESRGIDPT
jgi:hypothetical protein